MAIRLGPWPQALVRPPGLRATEPGPRGQCRAKAGLALVGLSKGEDNQEMQ